MYDHLGEVATAPVEEIVGRILSDTGYHEVLENSEAEEDQERLANLTEPPTEAVWLVLIGHGTYDGKEAKFNLRGPDVSDAELAEWLKACKRPLAVIDCSSSSAPFLNRLSGRDRVVITATRTGSAVS